MRFPEDVPVLTDGVVRLRAHDLDDVDGSLEQCLDPVSIAWTTVPVPYGREDARRFVTEAMPGGWRTDDEWGFAVEATDGGVPRYAGTVSLRNRGERRAEVAYGAHPWVRGRGLMTRAVRLLLDWGFASLDLDTVVWWANSGNWPSRRVAWRLGFDIARGTVRHWLPQRGVLVDAWVGTLLAGEEMTPRKAWYDAPRIVGERVVLREHRDEDAARIASAAADPRTRHWLSGWPDPFTLADGWAFIEGRREQRASGAGVTWVGADPADDRMIAQISVFDLEAGREAEVGYWTHPDARGTGVMTQALGLVARHCLLPTEDGGLGLRRLRIEAAEGNLASQHVIESCGFTHVGRSRRKVALGDGTLADALTFDLLASELRPLP